MTKQKPNNSNELQREREKVLEEIKKLLFDFSKVCYHAGGSNNYPEGGMTMAMVEEVTIQKIEAQFQSQLQSVFEEIENRLQFLLEPKIDEVIEEIRNKYCNSADHLRDSKEMAKNRTKSKYLQSRAYIASLLVDEMTPNDYIVMELLKTNGGKKLELPDDLETVRI